MTTEPATSMGTMFSTPTPALSTFTPFQPGTGTGFELTSQMYSTFTAIMPTTTGKENYIYIYIY